MDTPLTLIIIPFTLISVRSIGIKSSTSATGFLDVTYLGNSTASNLSVENINIDTFELTRTRNFNLKVENNFKTNGKSRTFDVDCSRNAISS